MNLVCRKFWTIFSDVFVTLKVFPVEGKNGAKEGKRARARAHTREKTERRIRIDLQDRFIDDDKTDERIEDGESRRPVITVYGHYCFYNSLLQDQLESRRREGARKEGKWTAGNARTDAVSRGYRRGASTGC